MRLAPKIFLSISLLGFAACEKPAPSAPTPSRVELTEGFLDYARWTKWIQSPPRVLLINPLDATSQKLIESQTRIFTTLVNPPPESNAVPVGDIQAQLDAVKKAFPAKGQMRPPGLYHAIDFPHHDRWDSYRRIIAHTTLTNLPAIITQLERKVSNDLADLAPQLRSAAVSGAQARADTKWLHETMTRQIEHLKSIGKPAYASLSSPAAKAREEWNLFEATDLPLIKNIIDASVISEANLAENGRFKLEGRGQLVAVVTVAGRQLYFTPQSPGELRFLNIKSDSWR